MDTPSDIVSSAIAILIMSLFFFLFYKFVINKFKNKSTRFVFKILFFIYLFFFCDILDIVAYFNKTNEPQGTVVIHGKRKQRGNTTVIYRKAEGRKVGPSETYYLYKRMPWSKVSRIKKSDESLSTNEYIQILQAFFYVLTFRKGLWYGVTHFEPI